MVSLESVPVILAPASKSILKGCRIFRFCLGGCKSLETLPCPKKLEHWRDPCFCWICSLNLGSLDLS